MISIADPADLERLSPEKFRIIHDFALTLDDFGLFGMHLSMRGKKRRIASFAWWDHADADIYNMTAEKIPLGTISNPYYSGEEAWEIQIWESGDYVYVIEGGGDYDDEHLTDQNEPKKFQRHFRVVKSIYLAQWEKLIKQVRSSARSFNSLEEALHHPTTTKSLLFGCRGLKTFPIEICRLVNLEYLNMYSNQIAKLPEELGSLCNLRWLDFNFNRLTMLPRSIGMLKKLQGLSLTSNKLTSIPDGLLSLKKLRSLSLNGNPIPPEETSRFYKLRPNLA